MDDTFNRIKLFKAVPAASVRHLLQEIKDRFFFPIIFFITIILSVSSIYEFWAAPGTSTAKGSHSLLNEY